MAARSHHKSVRRGRAHTIKHRNGKILTVTSCKLNCHDLFSLSLSSPFNFDAASKDAVRTRSLARPSHFYGHFHLPTAIMVCFFFVRIHFRLFFRIDYVSCVYFISLPRNRLLLQSLSRHHARCSCAFLHLFTRRAVAALQLYIWISLMDELSATIGSLFFAMLCACYDKQHKRYKRKSQIITTIDERRRERYSVLYGSQNMKKQWIAVVCFFFACRLLCRGVRVGSLLFASILSNWIK